MATYKGIDVSHWQGTINWSAVKNSGINFAIIKAGGSDAGFYVDQTFERNYSGAKACGLHVGAYYFVGAKCKSKADGEADAQRFIDILKGKQFDMPVYLDFEAPDASNISGNTDAAVAFCKAMENAGYYVGIYASDISGFQNRLIKSSLTPFTWWVARYGSAPVYAVENKHIWQYSSTGKVSGINGNVDMDESYVDFPTIIKSKGFNGYSASAVLQPKETSTAEIKVQPAPVKNSNTYYTVKSGDTLSGIAAKYGTTYQELARINGIADPNKIYAGQLIKLSGTSGSVTSASTSYTVKSGDTLSSIAKKYGTTWQDIYNRNKNVIGSNPNLIKPGQVLKIK